MSGGETCGALHVPGRLTAHSPSVASASERVGIHTTLTRSESRAMAVRQGRDASLPGMHQGAGSRAIRLDSSAGGSVASWSRAISASIPPRISHGSERRAMFQETIVRGNEWTSGVCSRTGRENSKDRGPADCRRDRERRLRRMGPEPLWRCWRGCRG